VFNCMYRAHGLHLGYGGTSHALEGNQSVRTTKTFCCPVQIRRLPTCYALPGVRHKPPHGLYKYIDRYEQFGEKGLLDLSRAPSSRPNSTSDTNLSYKNRRLSFYIDPDTLFVCNKVDL